MSTPSAGRQSVWAVITRDVIDTFGSAVAAEFCACPAHRVQVWANGGDPPTSKEQDRLRLLYAAAWTLQLRSAGVDAYSLEDLAERLMERRAANAGSRAHRGALT